MAKTAGTDEKTTSTNKSDNTNCSICNFNAHMRLWLVAIVGVAADLASKSWAISELGTPGQQQPLVIIKGYVRFITVFNPGAVGGIAAGKTTLLIVATVVAIGFLFWLFATTRSDQWVAHISLGMLLAGAFGNLYDRIFNDGQVIDFIEVNLHFFPADPWPTFNIADALLTVGVGLLIITLLVSNKKS